MALVLTIDSVDRTDDLYRDSLKIEQSGGAFTAVLSFKLNDPTSSLAIQSRDSVTVVDDGTTLFAGEVVDVDEDLLSLASDGRRLTVLCRDYQSLVEEAVIDGTEAYEDDTDSDILDDLFSNYRSDIDAVTYVATIETMTISFTDVTLRHAMADICGRSGANWYVDENLNLHYFTSEANVAAWHLSDSPDNMTSFPFHSIRKRRSATTIVNRLLVVGKEVRAWYEDAASVALYDERPAVVVDSRIETEPGLEERATAVLGKWAYPRESYDVVTSKEGLRAGMDVRLVCGAWGVDETLTVLRQTIAWRGDHRFHRLELGAGIANAVTAGRSWIDRIGTIEGQVNTVNDSVFDTDAPPTPTFVNANVATGVDLAGDGTQVVYFQVTWGVADADDLARYELQMSRSNDFSGHVVTRAHPPDGDRIERFESVLGNTAYYFRVRAIDWVGNVSAWSGTVTKTAAADTTAPADPTGVDAVATPISVHLTWVANSEADLDHYLVQRKLSGGSYSTIAQTRATLLIDNDVDVGSSYLYQVAAVDTSGNASSYVEIAAAVTVVAITPIDLAGVHSIALDGILALWHFDGPKPYETNFIVDTVSNHGHVGTVTGGVIGGPGEFGKGAEVTSGYTNLVINSSFEVGDPPTAWYASGTNTIARSGDQAKFGSYACKCTYQDNTILLYNAFPAGRLTAAQHYASAWIWVPSTWDGGDISLEWGNFAGDTPSVVTQWTAASDPTGEWFRIVSETTFDAGDLIGNLRVRASSAPTAGRYIYVDAVQVTATTGTRPYWDDSLNDSSFAHDATSTRTAGQLAYDELASEIGAQGSAVGRMVMGSLPSESGSMAYVLDARGADNNNWIMLRIGTDDRFDMYINGGYRISDVGSGSLSHGEGLFWAITWDFDANSYRLELWENGTQYTGTSSVSLSTPTLTSLKIGSAFNGTLQVNGVIDEVALFDRVLSTTEIQAIAESGAPLVDASQTYWLSEWQGWAHDLVFSATDEDTVAWTAGTITLRNGQAYDIDAGNTGNMAATTYVYLDRDDSETVLQTTTTMASSVGPNRLLIAVCENVVSGRKAVFNVFGGGPTGGVLIDIDNIDDVVGLSGWAHDLVFSATDEDTVAWAAGTITLPNGDTFSIDAGNTGDISALTYIYLDRGTSETELQTTTTASIAVGAGKLLLAVAEDVASGKNALFHVFGGNATTGVLITADNIVAGTITGNEIAANTIEAGNIAAGTITADEIAAATITGARIAANTIEAGNIAANTITANEIAANTITASEIAAGTITADEIAANTITAAEIAAGTITGTQIAADTITAANIAAATITATELSVTSLSAISGDMGSITAGTITGATFQTDSSGARIVINNSEGIIAYNAAAATVFNLYTTGAGLLGAGNIVWTAAGVVSMVAAYAGGGDVYIGSAGLFFESGNGDTNGVVWKSSVPSGDTEGYIRIRTDNALEIACGSADMSSYYEILITQVKNTGTLTPIRVSASNKAVGIFSGTISATPEGTLFVRNNDDGDWPVAYFDQNKTGGSNQPVAVFDQAAQERTIFKVIGSTSGSNPTISTTEKTTFTKAFKCEVGGAVGWCNIYT